MIKHFSWNQSIADNQKVDKNN